MNPEAKKTAWRKQRQSLSQTAPSFLPHGGLEGPSLKAGYLEDFRGAKAFFVDDPSAEDSRCILGDVACRGQREVGSEQNAFGHGQFAISAMKFVHRGQG